jgi:vacuolar-type H+-ATPase subunit E/Vma4
MALADILEELRRDGRAEIERIVDERDRTVAAIAERARADAEAAERAAARSRDQAITFEVEVVRNRAALGVERRLQEAREVLYAEIVGRARDRLSRLRDDPAYPAVVDALVAECATALGEVESVMADRRDVDVVAAAVAGRGIEAAVEPTLDTWGGIEARDGKGAFVRNTLEERLERVDAELRRQVGDLVPGLRGTQGP